MSPPEALAHAVDLIGGQSAMGRLIGVSQASVWRWVDRKEHLPAEHVLKVEERPGFSRHDLRPDIYPRDYPPAPDARFDGVDQQANRVAA